MLGTMEGGSCSDEVGVERPRFFARDQCSSIGQSQAATISPIYYPGSLQSNGVEPTQLQHASMRARSSRIIQHALRPQNILLRPGAFRFHIRCHVPHDRPLTTSGLSTVLLPPAVFAGLLVTLWSYKCLMLIIFQHKIIYMPFLPPYTRSERLEDYARQCGPVVWREERTRARDGVELVMAVGHVRDQEGTESNEKTPPGEKEDVIVVYFQGSVQFTPSNISEVPLKSRP